MQALSPERAQAALAAAVSLAAAALLAVVLAYWTWQWLAPRAEPRVQPIVEPAGGASPARGLFGTPQRERDSAAPTAIAVKLLGVVAATPGRRGYAVLQLEGRRILAVAAGEDAAPGIQVAEVHPDHVILSRGGVRESLAWPRRQGTAETAAPRVDK